MDTHPTLRAAYAFLYNELHQFQDSMEDLKRQSRREHEDLRREVRDLTLQTQDVLREIQELKQVINASTNLMVWHPLSQYTETDILTWAR